MQPEWAIEVRDRCEREGIPFFFKQWGGRTPKAGGGYLTESSIVLRLFIPKEGHPCNSVGTLTSLHL